MSNSNFGYRRLRLAFWCAAVILGALDAWATRNTMNPDGVSYLDMGDAYWRGDWHMAINAYWSPLYSWLTGLALKLIRPSGYWEYPVVHLVNFFVYLAALASFEFLLRAFIAGRRSSTRVTAEEEGVALPEWAWWTLGYSLFIWTSLVMIGMRYVTPDMCVAAFVYLGAGLLLRIRSGAATQRIFVLLGAAMGFGYLAKAVMFPLAFVFLGVALFSLGSVRKGAPRVVTSALVFLLIAGPFVAALSHSKGRLTFGDSGRVAQEVYIDGVGPFVPNSSTSSHPVKKIFEAPTAYEFAEPRGGTYPLWYDTSYWHEGIKPYFDLKGEVLAIASGLALYGWLLFSVFKQLNVTVGLSLLHLLAPRPSSALKRVAANWPLLVPALSALGLYSLVYAEYRYIAPFIVLLWLAAFSGVRLPASEGSTKVIAGVVIAVAATTGISLTRSAVRSLALARKVDSIYSEAAHALDEKGIRAGDKVAVIAKEPWGEGGAFVARLARVQIIAEVNEPDGFLAANPSTRSQVIDALAKAGAKAVVTSDDRLAASDACWQGLGNSRYGVCMLAPSAY